MPYSELIKDFSRIRDFMRDFYVYGFKRREEYNTKSPRSYDNERRRIDSWLGEYMSFRQDADGKQVFISIDSRGVTHNPLYKAFKAKTFTTRDIMLSFYILDVLEDDNSYTAREITDKIESSYLSVFDTPHDVDESTVRLKLKEYENIGIIQSVKNNNRLYYKLSRDDINLQQWEEALQFYSEEDPIGVIGSYLLDKPLQKNDVFRFKHHYILHALESEILYGILAAIDGKQNIEINVSASGHSKQSPKIVTPLKILISTQGGRRYLLANQQDAGKMKLYRLDSIKTVKILDRNDAFDELLAPACEFISKLWGVSQGGGTGTEHLEMIIRALPDEGFIVNRLKREKRCGSVTPLGDNLYCFAADVYDASEMLPWLRTFIGRIVSLECSNGLVCETFYSDLDALNGMYLQDGNITNSRT